MSIPFVYLLLVRPVPVYLYLMSIYIPVRIDMEDLMESEHLVGWKRTSFKTFIELKCLLLFRFIPLLVYNTDLKYSASVEMYTVFMYRISDFIKIMRHGKTFCVVLFPISYLTKCLLTWKRKRSKYNNVQMKTKLIT